MERLSAWMVRASLCWLLLGAVVGGLMLSDRLVPGDWIAWFLPTHAHVLLVGWLLQFVLAVAYWLFPRRRTPERPLGYDERSALVVAAALNVGLLVRTVAEPLGRAGSGGDGLPWALALSALLQVAAIAYFVGQLWPRSGPKSRVNPRSSPAEG